jgi:hypothetical protein
MLVSEAGAGAALRGSRWRRSRRRNRQAPAIPRPAARDRALGGSPTSSVRRPPRRAGGTHSRGGGTALPRGYVDDVAIAARHGARLHPTARAAESAAAHWPRWPVVLGRVHQPEQAFGADRGTAGNSAHQRAGAQRSSIRTARRGTLRAGRHRTPGRGHALARQARLAGDPTTGVGDQHGRHGGQAPARQTRSLRCERGLRIWRWTGASLRRSTAASTPRRSGGVAIVRSIGAQVRKEP